VFLCIPGCAYEEIKLCHHIFGASDVSCDAPNVSQELKALHKLESTEFVAKLAAFRSRMSYWYANEMDVSSEVFEFNEFIAQGYVQCFNEKCKMDGCLVHNHIRGKCMQHLYPSDASLLYGGHSTSAKACDVVDQMVHGDILHRVQLKV
jgi:hypothetical protein